MSSYSADKILRSIISTKSIPNGLIIYGEECECLFKFSIDFARSINCTCTPTTKTCDNCSLFSSLEHPDVKFVSPVLHSNPDDCCDNYSEEFKTFFIKKNGAFSLEIWSEFVSKQGKQVNILNNDIEKIKDFASLPPIIGEYKIIVLCFPETMNKYASNMLLKIMEDPTFDKTLFLFLTNDINRLLPTIRSRCLSVFLSHNNNSLSRYQNSIDENFKKKDARLNEVIMWLRHCLNSDYEKINIINEKIISLGKERVKDFLLRLLDVLNDLLYIKFNISPLETLNSIDDSINNICNSFSLQDIAYVFKKTNNEILNISRNINLKMMIFDLSIFISESLKSSKHCDAIYT